MMKRDEVSRPRCLTAIHTISRSSDPACEKGLRNHICHAGRDGRPSRSRPGTRRARRRDGRRLVPTLSAKEKPRAKDLLPMDKTIVPNKRTRPFPSYREMAERCRAMAAVSRRPGALLMLAETYDGAAAEIERDEQARAHGK
jgi:hypothetical protein